MRQDIRFAFRMISSHRWFSAAIVVTLGLGIGLNTMVFTLVNAALFKPVPLPNGDRLVAITSQDLSQSNQQMGVSYPDFRDYRAQSSSFEALEAASRESAVLSERGNPPQPYSMGRVSSGMFEMLQMRPILGRGFLPGDDKPGAEPVLLLGHTVWKDRYGSSGEVVGRQVRVNEKPATIIGVMPEGFKFPHEEDLWMALPPTTELEDRTHRSLELFGILKPGESIARASADLGAIAHRLAENHPESNKDTGSLVQTFHERYNGGNIKRVFLLMLIAVGFVLLTACANVANMMLSRTLARRREMSIRAALGASRWQLIRQLLIESVALSALGGVLGLGLCEIGIRWFDSVTQNVGKPYWVQFGMDYRVFAYFAAVCLFSGLLFGLAPALRSSRQDMSDALKDGVRSIGTRRGGRLSGMLVIGQFALTLVLLTGAGIFVRGFLESLSVNKMVPASELLTAAVRLPKGRYPGPDARQHFFDQLLPTLARIPGATHAAIVSNLPATWAPGRHIEIEGGPTIDPAHRPSASFLVQSPGYFAAINIPILLGRDFKDTDGSAGNGSAIVTKEFAEKYWPNQPAIGKRFRFYTDDKPGDWMPVVGVSANLVQLPNEPNPDPLVFLPYRQEQNDSMFLVLRSNGNPSSEVSAVRAAVQNLDQDLPLFEVGTLTEVVRHNLWFFRVFGVLFAVFAAIALVIASVGFYAVIAQATNSRTQEIGVRMALGATSGNIIGLVLTRGLKQLAGGMILGLAVAIPAAKLITSLVVQVSPRDPFVFGSVALLLTSVGLFACWLPARRAAALHPVNAIWRW